MLRLPERRERFRRILEGSECIFPASVFDPSSARIAEELGFEVGMFSGSIGSATVLGAPDLVVLTLSEFAEQARRITRAGNISLMVDADHGYGNALNVMRTVEELETAGVSALTIEDMVLPEPFGGDQVGSVSLPEVLAKLRAAVEARQDPSLVIIGRTVVLRRAGLSKTVERVRAYHDTGVDAIFVVGARAREEIEALHQASTLPLLLGDTPPPIRDREFLAANGVRMALQGHHPFYASVKAVYDTLKHLKDGGVPEDLKDNVATGEILDVAQQRQEYARRQREYLR